MNITTGGPHILLFERDQQLATLLTSELQLAGYTNHTARTAVEVFDAIARYPVRLVLVNLAQAATARREFWVALDSQRRDRKVQVLTFVCTNLAGYGSREFEETNHGTIADMEIDGMLGLMSLVDAVRTRVPGTAVDNGGNTMPRLPRISGQTTSMPSVSANQRATTSPAANGTGNSGSLFRPAFANDANQNITPVQVPPKSSAPTQPQAPYNTPLRSAPSTLTPTQTTGQQPTLSPATGLSGSLQPSYSEKIRAVLYPNQRAWNTQNSDTYPAVKNQQETNMSQAQAQVEPQPRPQPQPQINVQPQANAQSQSQTAAPFQSHTFAPGIYNAPPATPQFTASNVLQRMANGQISEPTNESGLAQLSRMAQGFRPYVPSQNGQPLPSTPYAPAQNQPLQDIPHTPVQDNQPLQDIPYTPVQDSQPVQDMPYPAAQTNHFLQNTQYGLTQSTQPLQYPQPAPNDNPWSLPAGTPYASLETDETTESIVNLTQASPIHKQADQQQREQPQQSMASYSTYNVPVGQTTSPTDEININTQTLRASPIQDMPIERTVTGPAVGDNNKRLDNRTDGYSRTTYTPQAPAHPAQGTGITSQQAASAVTPSPLASIANPMPAPTPAPTQPQTPPLTHKTETPAHAKEQMFSSKEALQQEAIEYIKEKAQQTRNATKQEDAAHSFLEEELAEDSEENIASNNAVLLDIVQSLPPMPALTKQQQQQSVQPQVLNGRATRSLNKVLLDGHLVPEDRLEVAQSIQRMLRGVDLNYQLGEILLMFKLLTPDQLLAASLVSFGMLNTTQISALGRIRQELHSMGLEYDLENLLVLFRILTPEQLREVRSSLQG